MTRSEINGPQTSECRPACRLDRGDPVIVDEAVDKRRAVAIESRLRPVGQEADRNAGLPEAITPCFWYLERIERIHSARWPLSQVRWYPKMLRPKSIDQQMLATKGLAGDSVSASLRSQPPRPHCFRNGSLGPAASHRPAPGKCWNHCALHASEYGSLLRLIDNGYRMTQCSGGVRQGR
jgi:hypothetical protein